MLKQTALHGINKQKMEFSKIIYIINLILVTIVMGMSFLCVIKSGEWGIIDLSPITVICTSAFTSLSVASLFYYRKSQAENVIKISKQIGNIDNEKVELANRVMSGEFNNNV